MLFLLSQNGSSEEILSQRKDFPQWFEKTDAFCTECDQGV